MKGKPILTLLLCFFLTSALGQDGKKKEWDLPVLPPSRGTEKEQKKEDPPPPEPVTPAPPNFGGEAIPTKNSTIVYVIDISGSMTILNDSKIIDLNGNAVSGTRLDRAKMELHRSILALDVSYRFNIVAYSCTMMSWSKDLKTATQENKKAAIEFVNRLFAGGGTGTAYGVSIALEDKNVMALVLLTDGMPSCGNEGSDPFEFHRQLIKKNNTQKAIITVFGIGAATYAQTKDFCQKVATDNGGNFSELK